jgi:hypothetical protein
VGSPFSREATLRKTAAWVVTSGCPTVPVPAPAGPQDGPGSQRHGDDDEQQRERKPDQSQQQRHESPGKGRTRVGLEAVSHLCLLSGAPACSFVTEPVKDLGNA